MALQGWKLRKKGTVENAVMLLYSTTIRNYDEDCCNELEKPVLDGSIYILRGVAVVN